MYRAMIEAARIELGFASKPNDSVPFVYFVKKFKYHEGPGLRFGEHYGRFPEEIWKLLKPYFEGVVFDDQYCGGGWVALNHEPPSLN